MKKINLKLIVIFSFITTAFVFDSDKFLIGKWQSLNDRTAVLEFTLNNEIILYKNSISFWSLATKNGELKFIVLNKTDSWIEFETRDGDDFVFKGKIEIVNKERIRVYYYKHHDILDIADEYHRTTDFDSFDIIMKSILDD